MQQIADRSAVGRARAANGTHCSRHAGGGTHFPRSCTGARSISYRVGTKRVPSAPKPQNLGLENSKQLTTGNSTHTKERAPPPTNNQPTNAAVTSIVRKPQMRERCLWLSTQLRRPASKISSIKGHSRNAKSIASEFERFMGLTYSADNTIYPEGNLLPLTRKSLDHSASQ
jgi:hypothetical protein